MTIKASNLEELSKISKSNLLLKTPYADVKNWEENLRSLYIKGLDIVDYGNGRDSSFQYYIITNPNFKLKTDQYIDLIDNMSESDVSDLLFSNNRHENFNRDVVFERLRGQKGGKAYLLSFHIIALECRALIEAIRIKKFSKELEVKFINYCQRSLASSFHPDYH